jgi:hypothetical protein
MEIDIAITGISYGDSRRLPEFTNLLAEIDDFLKVKHSLVLWQPPVIFGADKKEPSLIWADIYFTRFAYRRMFRKLESRFGAPLQTRLLRELAFFAKLPLILRYLNPGYRRIRTQVRSREIFLNSKHRLAWLNFLEGDSDLLLVLEDDATPTDPLWKPKLMESVSTAGKFMLDSTMLNLAPFFDLGGLVPELRSKSDFHEGDWRSLGFYANTTAAYIINRLAAKDLLTGFIKSPKYTLESIDFAMTMIALEGRLHVNYLERDPIVFQNLSQVKGESSLSS